MGSGWAGPLGLCGQARSWVLFPAAGPRRGSQTQEESTLSPGGHTQARSLAQWTRLPRFLLAGVHTAGSFPPHLSEGLAAGGLHRTSVTSWMQWAAATTADILAPSWGMAFPPQLSPAGGCPFLFTPQTCSHTPDRHIRVRNCVSLGASCGALGGSGTESKAALPDLQALGAPGGTWVRVHGRTWVPGPVSS